MGMREAVVIGGMIAAGIVAAPWLAPQPARAAGTAIVYEYKHLTVLHVARDRIVNEEAAGGWEPVFVTQPGHNSDFLFRRPKP